MMELEENIIWKERTWFLWYYTILPSNLWMFEEILVSMGGPIPIMEKGVIDELV